MQKQRMSRSFHLGKWRKKGRLHRVHGPRKYERYRQLAKRRAGSSAAAAPDIVHR
mgnify:CR=1 FL=1